MNVLLVRNPPEGAPDRYRQHLESIGLHPYSVPVLETVYTNLGDLRDTLERKSSSYGGVIMTSSRSADCWDLIIQELSSPARGVSVSSGGQFHVFVCAGHELLNRAEQIGPASHSTSWVQRQGMFSEICQYLLSPLPLRTL